MIFKGKSKFDNLDQYLAQRDYTAALEAIAEEIRRKPEAFNLLLRQAEILGLAGDRESAIAIYRKLARQFADDGFYARAIAVTNKLLRLDPEHPEVNRELAQLIATRQQAEDEARQRFKGARPARPQPVEAPVPPAPPAPVPEAQVPEPPVLESREPAPGEPSPEADLPILVTDEPTSEQIERERQASRFFAEFPAHALEELLDSTSVRTYAPEETIVREGEPGLSLFLIEEGTVEIVTQDPAGRPLVLSRLGAGEFFGEVSVLTGRPRTATIIAKSPVTAIEIFRDDLNRISDRHPTVREVLRRFYEQRAQATVEAMIARLRAPRG